MARVTSVVDPRPATVRLRRVLRDGFLFVDATMLRIGGRHDELYEARKILRELPGTLLDAEGLAARNAPANGTYGDLIHVLPEGALFVPSFVGGHVHGMHGYDRGTSSTEAAVLSDVPVNHRLHGLEDIAPSVLESLEIPRGRR